MLKFPKLTGLICLNIWISLLSLQAQDDTCIRFEDLPANAQYGKDGGHAPGDLAFSLKGVDVYLEEFLYSNTDEIGFWNATVATDIFGNQPALDGQSLFISNINLQFDFTKLDNPVNGVCFMIVDGGGEENIAVNGQPITILPDFSEVPAEIAPGVTLSVRHLPATDNTSLRNTEVCLRGKIESLTIGGQEFGLDNLCYYYEPCTLSDLKAEIVNCQYVNNEVYVYELDVDFSWASSAADQQFDLFVNGVFRGYYNTADLPVRVKEIRVLGTTENFEVEVCANDRPYCCSRIKLPNTGCPANCGLEGVEIGNIECSFDGYYYAKISTKGTNLSGAITITNEKGETWTGPADGSVPVKFSIPDQQYDKWTVCDSQYPDCCFTIDFDVPCPSCRIGPLQAETSECSDDGMFFIKLDFDHLTPTGQFYVYINGEEHGAYAYSNLPLELGPFPANTDTGWKILVQDASQQCAQDLYLEPVSCPPNNCRIGPLSISEPECTASGQFFFKLDFEHELTSEKFQVFLNGEVFESYAYENLPVRVGPLPADGATDWKVLVKDDNGACAEDAGFGPVDCKLLDCEIGPLQLSGPVCTDNGEFFFKLDFKYQNTSERFRVVLNGEVFETYAYNDLPVRVGPLPADGTTDWHVLVQDQFEHCASDAKFEAVNCQPETCEIGELDVSGPICIPGSTQFYFKLNFKYWNTSEKFVLLINEDQYETYSYEDLPIRVGPFSADANQVQWKLQVVDASEKCRREGVLSGAVCNPELCEIGELDVSGPVCLDDGQFFFKLDFKYFNTSDRFQVLLNNEVFETYAYENLPVRVGPLPADGTTDWLIQVRDISQNCGRDTKLPAVQCYPDECRIGPLQISEPLCTDASGQFLFELNFDHKNTSEAFRLYLNGDLYEQFPYQELPVTIGPLTADGITDWHILVEDLNGACAEDAHLEAVNCNPKECVIGDLKISEPICADDGQFYFELNFEHKNTSEKFQLLIDQDVYEHYSYADLPVKVGPLPAINKERHILVRDLSTTNTVFCASEGILSPAPCPAPCKIGALKVSEPICTNTGEFYLELNFDHQNTGEKFLLYVNQDLYESYAYATLPIKIGPFPANTDKGWHLLVRDAGTDTPTTNTCASDINIPAVSCPPNGSCEIGELKISDGKCTDNGEFFYISLDFEHKNTASTFQLYLNNELYGSFAYQELPMKLGPLNALIDVEWHLVVKDASGECTAETKFNAPDCGGGGGTCNLSGLKVERYPCIGGQFLVDLFFDIKDPGPLGYYVFTNGQISGPYSYDQPFITLGPFAGDGTTTHDFLVIDIEDPSCYGYYELEPVDCSNPCSISDVKAEVHACNDKGEFLVDISFSYDKVGSSGFTIRGNGVVYGEFEYGQPFYTVGPLTGDGSTVYEFAVIDKDKPDCRDFTTIEPVDCFPCKLGELEYTVQCLSNAQKFVLNLDFGHDHPDSETFVLAIGDQIAGTYPYAGLPLSLELELPANGNMVVAVWDSKIENCAQKAEFVIPCCYLSEPVVEAHPCENDGELWVDLDLKYYNVSESFQLVYGPPSDVRVATYKYSDLPVTLGPLPGQITDEWLFEVTDLGYFCQSSTTFSPEYCDNDTCAEWDKTPAGAYGPLTGYDPGDLIDEEDGLRLSFAPANQPDCNCSVFIMKSTTFPAFPQANGHLVLLDNSGALISAPGYEIQSLTVDYYYTGQEALLKINGEKIIAAGHPTGFPEDIAPGVTLKVEPLSNDGKQGRMTFSGSIYRLTFLARGPWALDNFCTEKAEKEDEVWPGDTNLDNVANHIDLLNIGLGFDELGPPRTNAAINWQAQPAEDWPGLFFDNDLNFKHADANGDGIINRADRGPIMENYGLAHGPLPVNSEILATENDPPLYVDFDALAEPIPVGGTFQVPIVFGTESLPVKDIYGIAFTVTFDPNTIDPTSIEVVYPDSWLGDTQSNLLTIDRTLAESGRIDIAMTRVDKINVGGFGPIASLIGAIDDIAGKETTLGITEVVAITANEDRVPVNGKESLVEFFDGLQPDVGYIDINASLNIFPNPTSSEVLVTTRFNFPIERIRVLDGYGNPTGLQVAGKNRIDLSQLPSGVYMLRIQLSKYTVSRKIIKVN